MTRALVTGANGFMGMHMIELLVAEGHETLGTDIAPDKPDALKDVPYEYAPCDLRDPQAVARLVAGRGPFDHVYHIAGLFDYSASFADLHAVNVQGTYNLLWQLSYDSDRGRFRSRGEMPKRVVVWGAAGVYDFAKESPAKETSPTNPRGGYLYTKWSEEQLALQMGDLGLPVAIIRPGGVYGPRSRYGVATSIFVAARGGLGPVFAGSKKVRGSTVHVVDVCRAAAFLAGRDEAVQQIYNVGDDSAYTLYELTRALAKRLDFPVLPVALPLGLQKTMVGNLMKKAARKGRASMLNTEMVDLLAHDALLDTAKLKALGWSPRYPDAMKGLMETVEWYEKEGWL
jgi:nucleoside-diphosphate-sugar epimerase